MRLVLVLNMLSSLNKDIIIIIIITIGPVSIGVEKQRNTDGYTLSTKGSTLLDTPGINTAGHPSDQHCWTSKRSTLLDSTGINTNGHPRD